MLRSALAMCFALPILAAGCSTSTETKPSKAEARRLVAKGDIPVDICEVFGFYDDGECDDFCSEPDSDCPFDGPVSCWTDATCANGYCDRPENAGALEPGTCIYPNCDDGPAVCLQVPPTCDGGLIVAVKNACYQCVDPRTCEPPAPPAQLPECDVFCGTACTDAPVSPEWNVCTPFPWVRCLGDATCERNAAGQCAWRLTPEEEQCVTILRDSLLGGTPYRPTES